MKKYGLFLALILFMQQSNATLLWDGGPIFFNNKFEPSDSDEKAYQEALSAYQQWIIRFGEIQYKHLKNPKNPPANYTRFFIEWYKIMQTYCKKTTPQINQNDDDFEETCALKFARKIQADPKIFPEVKSLILSAFFHTDFVPMPDEFLLGSITSPKE